MVHKRFLLSMVTPFDPP